MGFKTGHYTSPHILEFNERIWLNGKNASDEILDSAHLKLLHLLSMNDADSLSYFEYTTLLCILIYKDCDYVVLEAGLGGENDATAVFSKVLTLVTPIDYDHQSFLGNTLKEIVTTKLNAIQNSAVLAKQKHEEVYEIAKKLSSEKSLNIKNVDELLSAEDNEKIANISSSLSLANYLAQNLSLAISAMNFLNISYSESDFNDARLFGRLSKIRENIIVDVGHNPLAASSILTALSPNKYILVYNSYQDKDYKKILHILKPIILHVEIIDINESRVESLELLKDTLDSLDIKHMIFKDVKPDVSYLVFGSFSVVEAFMRRDLTYE